MPPPPPAPIPVPGPGDLETPPSSSVPLPAAPSAPSASPAPPTPSATQPQVSQVQEEAAAELTYVGTGTPPPGVASLVPEEGDHTVLARAARGATAMANQVAGHAGVLVDDSGSLVIKPALPREIAFYQLVQCSPRTAPISGLKPFLPKFYGTLALTGHVDDSEFEPVPVANALPESIVLENLTYRFTHPSVLDAKLGTSLHAPDASEEKKARMMKKAAETTTGQAGVRLTGASTWHAPTQSFIKTPRGFGYNAKLDDLPEGVKRFFPLPSDVLPFLSDDGDTGPEYKDHALPPSLASRLLAELDVELGRLEDVLSQIELRAVGASVLVVYEGDADRLAAAFDRFDRQRVTNAAKSLNPEPEDSDEEEEESESDSDDDEDDDGAAADARRASKCPPLVVRLIDFAHTWLEEGEGPDEGVLLGLRTLRGLVQGRRAAVDAYVAN
ncbi:hypothetical protein CspeluHIS016_0304850 [Cutaneotrichosporon spelunceum]|uniref:Kinase n=1 Tax=Cutaneotrichosporon spelunceum TaxID=1672016 RepID=A0AAD3YB30_9TREE|nr:hypothetical protein CspeluHIS016_0304850 [Cutaneotrichosporon spelunceum]